MAAGISRRSPFVRSSRSRMPPGSRWQWDCTGKLQKSVLLPTPVISLCGTSLIAWPTSYNLSSCVLARQVVVVFITILLIPAFLRAVECPGRAEGSAIIARQRLLLASDGLVRPRFRPLLHFGMRLLFHDCPPFGSLRNCRTTGAC